MRKIEVLRFDWNDASAGTRNACSIPAEHQTFDHRSLNGWLNFRGSVHQGSSGAQLDGSGFIQMIYARMTAADFPSACVCLCPSTGQVLPVREKHSGKSCNLW